MPKVTYACIDCGKERTAYASQFGKSREDYVCIDCHLKKKRVEDVIYTCIDCGAQRVGKPSEFSKIRENYRCKSCALKTKERRENISKQAKLKWEDPIYRKTISEKVKQAWEDPDLLKWRSDKSIELWSDPEFRDKTISRLNDPEIILRLREHYYDNPDYKLEASERAKQLWGDSEYAIITRAAMKTEEAKNNRSAASKITWSDPNLIDMRSQDSQRRWDDPIERQKMVDAMREAGSRPDVIEKKRKEMVQQWADPKIREMRIKSLPRGEDNHMFGKHLSEERKIEIGNNNRGENSGMWRGGTSFQSYCPKFNERRKRAVREFFDNICICCGKTVFENIFRHRQPALSVHHVDHDKEQGCGGAPFNLVPLCNMCHTAELHHIEDYKKYINKTLDEGFKWGIWDEKEYELKVMYPE